MSSQTSLALPGTGRRAVRILAHGDVAVAAWAALAALANLATDLATGIVVAWSRSRFSSWWRRSS
jgi:hypothetical protein